MIEIIINNKFQYFTDFNLDDRAKSYVKNALANYTKTLNSLQMHAMIYTSMQKGFCKTHRVSPDAIMQLGFQLAYLKQNGIMLAPINHRRFSSRPHRETVGPCTMATRVLWHNFGHQKRFIDIEQSRATSTHWEMFSSSWAID